MNVDTSRQGQGPSGRTLLILLALAFVGGAILSGWIITRSGWFDEPAPAQAAIDRNVITADPANPSPAAVPPSMATGMLTGPVPGRALDDRVAELENRLSLINVQAQAASGNAGRAEGLLIAFAARRALDRASALGYLEGQLQLRFGAAQPNAVATIIRASRNPVTMDQLRAQLDEIGPSLVSGRGSNEGFWDALHREASELFVIEQEGTVSQTPTQRVQRARRYLEAGRVEAALTEIEQLPGRAKAASWITRARSYAEARRALDIIESAAILEPRGLRDATGQPIEQPSPLAPPVPAN
ncbi:hypothetical protein [Blastomonas sp. SL216]|uniref:hypothetical protein n=1 Tax=Blastomonas sp. SL216 TaxID=2995169 RepID=UPI0023778BFA|nr:hypothetical protein OU999_14890 [Blastomonas sp. SL216]